MLGAHFRPNAGRIQHAGIMAGNPPTRRTVAAFTAHAVIQAHRAIGAGPRGGVTSQTHGRGCGIRQPQIARNKAAATVVQHGPSAAMRAAGGTGFLPNFQLILAHQIAIAVHAAVARRPSARRHARIRRTTFALRPRGRGPEKSEPDQTHQGQHQKAHGFCAAAPMPLVHGHCHDMDSPHRPHKAQHLNQNPAACHPDRARFIADYPPLSWQNSTNLSAHFRKFYGFSCNPHHNLRIFLMLIQQPRSRNLWALTLAVDLSPFACHKAVIQNKKV